MAARRDRLYELVTVRHGDGGALMSASCAWCGWVSPLCLPGPRAEALVRAHLGVEHGLELTEVPA